MADPLSDFVIPAAYALTATDRSQISKVAQNGLNDCSWGDKRLNGYKHRFKEAMHGHQNDHCAYCRTLVRLGNSGFDIDHIVPKKPHPQWVLLQENLCLACKRCNTAKGDTEVMRHPDLPNYPTTADEFLIVNPYLDNYYDHIELVRDLFYRGKTGKGIFTIKTCNLARCELVLDRVKERMEDARKAQRKMSYVALMADITSNVKLIKGFKKLRQEIYAMANKYRQANQPVIQ